MERRAVLVAGMHRSGTSALTELVAAAGAALPQRMLPPQPDNPRGFFEPERIVAFDDLLLRSSGLDWASWRSLPDWSAHLRDRPHLVERLVAHIEADYGDAPCFVVKDPRLGRLLPVWQVALRRLGACPVVVVPFRHPWEVARSLVERDGIPVAQGQLMWLRHLVDAERTSRDLPRAFCSYDTLLEQPAQAVERAMAHLGITGHVDHTLGDVVDPSLRHHRAPAEGCYAGVPGWLESVHRAHLRLATDPRDPAAMALLDVVGAELEAAEPMLAAVARGAQQRLAEEVDQREQAHRDLEQERLRGDDLHRRLVRTRRRLRTAQGRVRALERPPAPPSIAARARDWVSRRRRSRAAS